MAIQYNTNIKVATPNPIDDRYLSPVVVAGRQQPYTGITHANTLLNIGQDRHIGLTINIGSDEYWYKTGVTDSDLIIKKYATDTIFNDFVSGATNLGLFSGYSGVQTLTISTSISGYDGNYNSLYNYYYRDSNGVIRIGSSPSDGLNRRAYVRVTTPNRSFIWNERESGTEDIGWILINGDVSKMIGTFVAGVVYYNGTTTFPYQQNSFVAGQSYNNSSDLFISTVTGSLTDGVPLTIGGGVYTNLNDGILEFRTLISQNNNIKITSDDYFVYLSGVSASGNNLGVDGVGIYKETVNNTLQFKKLVESGSTYITETSDSIIINSTGGDGQVYYGGDNIDIDENNNINAEGLVLIQEFNTYKNIISPIIDTAITGGTNGLNNIFPRKIGLGGTLDRNTTISGITHTFNINTKSIDLQAINGINLIDTDGIGGINIESDGGAISIIGNDTVQSEKTRIDVSHSSLMISDYRDNQKGIEYTGCYHSGYTNRSLVDKEYVDKKITIYNVNNVNTTYTATTSNDYIGVSGATYIFLVENPVVGKKIIISDICGDAYNNPITIDGNGNNIIDSMCANIDTDYGSIMVLYNGYFWDVIGFTN